MALPRGQVDRFGNPIPANQSVKVWINSDGTVPQQRETVKLDANIVASDDAATGATLLTVQGAGASAISSLTGDVVAVGSGAAAATIQAGVVTSAKLATMAANTIKGNATGATAAPTDIPYSGASLGRLAIPVLIDTQSFTTAATYTTPTWASGAYSRVFMEIEGTMSTFAGIFLRVNADAGNNYNTQGSLVAAAVSADTAMAASHATVMTGANSGSGQFMAQISFFPLTTGRKRFGFSEAYAETANAATSSFSSRYSFDWIDTATAVTSLTLLTGSGTMTGTIRVYGIPA